MIKSIETIELQKYVSAQINNMFPDNVNIDFLKDQEIFDIALSRLEFCFKHVNLKHYFNGEEVVFNHLYSDHYVMFLWLLSNVVFQKKGACPLANKIYYLNKVLNGLDCMYNAQLPSIFLLFHSTGTMLGNARYNDFFVALQGCTVGSQKGNYPILGKGVSLTANSSVIGKCEIGDRSTISTRTIIFEKNISSDHTAFINFETGCLEIKPTKKCFAQQFFNVDLTKL